MSDQPYVNLLDPEFYVDPWQAYRWLRRKAMNESKKIGVVAAELLAAAHREEGK